MTNPIYFLVVGTKMVMNFPIPQPLEDFANLWIVKTFSETTFNDVVHIKERKKEGKKKVKQEGKKDDNNYSNSESYSSHNE